MKQQEFLRAIKQLGSSEVADLICNTDPEVLNACKPKIISLYRQVYRFSGGGNGRAENPMMLDDDAVVVAIINTTNLSDILKLKRIPIPFWAPVSDFFEQHKPEWMAEALELLLRPDDVLYLEPIWRDGLYEVPSCHALVHGYFDVRQSGKLDEALLLEGLIWRFFETEGTSTHSLSSHDKAAMWNQKLGFKSEATTWAERLLKYSQDGKLNRTRLISESLLALQKMERTPDIRWFAKFHRSLEPSFEEVDKNRDLYEALGNATNATKVKLGNDFSKVI